MNLLFLSVINKQFFYKKVKIREYMGKKHTKAILYIYMYLSHNLFNKTK